MFIKKGTIKNNKMRTIHRIIRIIILIIPWNYNRNNELARNKEQQKDFQGIRNKK